VADRDAFPAIFDRLRGILSQHVPPLVVTAVGSASYSLAVDRPDILPEQRRYFGGVAIQKNYVSCYLMGVYSDPRLADSLSPRLRQRMQGKSCFNFNTIDEELLEELGGVTARAVPRYLEVLDLYLAGRR
jgi:hypothetical protein